MEYGLGRLRLARSCEIGTESNSRSYMYVIYLHFGVRGMRYACHFVSESSNALPLFFSSSYSSLKSEKFSLGKIVGK